MAETRRGMPGEWKDEPMIGSANHPAYVVRKRERSRFWEVIDPAGELVCLTVYKRGAAEVVRRLVG